MLGTKGSRMNDLIASAQPRPERSKLTVKEDEFSVKLTLDEDPKFWWRVEKTGDRTFLITDFVPGAQDDQTMAVALMALITQRIQAPPMTVIFHDLVPGSPEPGAYRIRLNEVAQAVESWSRLAAELMELSVADTQLKTYRGKSRMIVTLH